MSPAPHRATNRNRAREVHWDKATTRVLDLVVALDDRPRSLSWIHLNVRGYTTGDIDAVRKRFDRDRRLLAGVGIELAEATGVDGDGAPEVQYRVDRDLSFLPDLGITPGEWDVLSPAARWVPNGSLTAPVQRALTKLAAIAPEPSSGTIGDVGNVTGQVPDAQDLTDDDIATLHRALDRNLTLDFHYWPALTETPQDRHLDPWAVAAVGGKLYLTGFDRDRGAQRTFRLSRVADLSVGSDIVRHGPPDRPASALVTEGLQASSVMVTAQVLFRGEGAQELRALGRVGPDDGSAHPDGTVLTVGPVERTWLVRQACAYAPDAIVLSPPDVVADVVSQLELAAARFGEETP
ncbi:MAG: helix-turn-helix transcriptional regulator [Mycobacteriaceae bacterium]|uniref:helix-turn-helix transcriptional regulator n=1 Tax=Corynebacterium sp. TaxID=1720 RepID=UPI003F980EE8